MKVGRFVMGTLYLGAGVLHFVATSRYVAIMPPYLPAQRELVLISGAAEIAGGAGLLVPRTRFAAAIGLLALYVAVFPANVNMALHPIASFAWVPRWVLWARLPLQALLIAWAWWVRKSGAARNDGVD